MRILLTGATGFLGSHLLRALCRNGHDVTILKRTTSDTYRIFDVLPVCKSYDLNQESIDQIFDHESIDVVIHCATVYGRQGESAESVLEGNLLFPLRLLETAIRHKCKYFINTDSFFCKQLPERFERQKALYLPEYTLSKYQFREWGKLKAIESGCVFVNLQMEHIYGPGDGSGKFVPWLEKKLQDGVPYVDLTDGIQLRDFVHVEDVVSVYLRVLNDMKHFSGYQSFEVGTGITKSVREFVEERKEKAGAATELRFGRIRRKETEIMYSTASSDSPYLVAKDREENR